tara:strand:+ start:110 stop:2236 length:2127 start_codon:yes stop_codon:yes gene_type:complete
MSDLVKDLTQYRISGIEKAEVEYYQSLTRTLDKIEDQIISLASKELPTQAGQLMELQSAVALRPKIKAILDKEYLPFADRVVRKGFGEQAKRVERQFKTLGIIPPQFRELTKSDLSLIKNLKQQYYTQFKDVSNNFTRILSDKVYQNTLVGNSFVELEEELRQSINGIYSTSNDPAVNRLVNYVKTNQNNPALKARVDLAIQQLQTKYARTRTGENMRRYAGQILNDSLRDFDATLNFNKAKDAGLKFVKYYGDVIPTTRDLCRRMINGELNKRDNGLFSIDEIKEIWRSRTWSGKKSGNPLTVRGGYNCRHQFSYVNPDWYDEDGKDSSLLKETKEDTKPTTSIFGNISNEERKYLPLAFGTVATTFTRAISKIPKSPTIKKLRGDNAFYRPSTDEINLSDFNIENNLRARRIYAHEFGHKIDHNIGNLMLDKKDIAKKIIPNPNRLVVDIKPTTKKFAGGGSVTFSGRSKTLFDDVVDERKGKNTVQLSNAAQIEIMEDRVNLKDNIKVGLTNYTEDLTSLANKIQGKSFDQRLAIRTKYLDDIINEKSFPLNKNEVRILLREKGITYDPMTTQTIDFVTSIKYKLLVSRYGKPLKLKLKNGETFKASTREAGRGFDPMFGDYVGAITNNAIGFGHKLSYYENFIATETIKKGYGKITYGHTTEAFANFTALSNTDNKEIYIKLMNYYAPQTTKTFSELYERSNLL